MTESELRKMEELYEKATPGPWLKNSWCGDDNVWAAIGPVHKQKDDEEELCDSSDAAEQADQDATFIAIARTLVPKLIQRVRKLESQFATVVEALEWYSDNIRYNYRSETQSCGCCSNLFEPEVLDDLGQRARTALEKLKGGGK